MEDACHTHKRTSQGQGTKAMVKRMTGKRSTKGENMESRLYRYLILAPLALLIAACGPATFTRQRTVMEPYDNRELRQDKDGVIVELKLGRKFPPTFQANVARCNAKNQIIVDQFGNQAMETISLARSNQLWSEIAITNQTSHVIRLNSVVLRLFDPSGTQYEPLTGDDLGAQLLAERPCPSTAQALNMFRVNKIFNRNIEIVPGTTSTFWMAYTPASRNMPGIWKFSVYELPVVLDSSGRPTKTTHFDMRVVAKQVTETLHQENPLEPAKVISTSVSSPTDAPSPPSASSPAPSVTASPKVAEPAAQPAKPSSSTTGVAPTRDVIARAQARLKELGFDAGTADGLAGAKTASAVRAFQASRKLPVTGTLDAATLKALNVN